jgi:hypothetical protein
MKKVGSFLDRFIRTIFRIAVYLGAIALIVLGAHGVYVYTSRIEVFFGAQTTKLFLTMTVPMPVQKTVTWMSGKGFESWIIPAVFIVGGILLWKFEAEIEYFIFRRIPNTLMGR